MNQRYHVPETVFPHSPRLFLGFSPTTAVFLWLRGASKSHPFLPSGDFISRWTRLVRQTSSDEWLNDRTWALPFLKNCFCCLKSWGGTLPMQGYDFFWKKIYQAQAPLHVALPVPVKISKQKA